MLKAAQKSKLDLVNWLRPTLQVNRTPGFEHRLVEPMEYAKLVDILLNPPLAPSRREERKGLWREAGDVVQFIRDIVHRQINEGLTDGELLFPHAKPATFDHAIARACRNAAKLANLNYGRTNGFTCHSLRHTFVTDMMEASGNNYQRM